MSTRPTLRLAALADLHGHLPDPATFPACDVLLLGGDLCPGHNPEMQADWLARSFAAWLAALPAREVVAVAGNHDFVFQTHPHRVPPLRWHYLQDRGVQLFDRWFWGSPWQPVFFNWAFNAAEVELSERWAAIPETTEILVLHGPPHGFGDRTLRGDRAGSTSLATRLAGLAQQNLRLAIFGHIHEDRGAWTLGSAVLANVSQMDGRHRPQHPPFVLDLD